METRTTTLLNLHSDTLTNEVAKPDNLATSSVINLSLANKYIYQLFKPTLFQRLKKYIERSEKKQVETLFKIHRDFDVSQLRHIFLTALKDRDIDMCRAIARGREGVLKQIEFLPKKLVDETNTYDFSVVVKAIESGQNVEEVLAKMRTDLDEIVKEKGFPFQSLLNAYDTYEKKYYPWTQRQCELFSVKVIGYLQRISPIWLKKALAISVYDIVNRTTSKLDMVRGDTFILKSGESIDPARIVPNSGLGFDFFVGLYGEYATRWVSLIPLLPTRSQLFERLFADKTAELGKLIHRQYNQHRACVIV